MTMSYKVLSTVSSGAVSSGPSMLLMGFVVLVVTGRLVVGAASGFSGPTSGSGSHSPQSVSKK